MSSSLLLLLLFFFLNPLFFLPATIIADDLGVVYSNCLSNATTNNNTLSSTFQDNLNLALSDLKNLSSSGTRYSITFTGSGIDKVYAMIQCRGDQSLQGCYDCVSNATTTLQSDCPSSIGARIQLAACYLRYDNQSFVTPDFSSVLALCNTAKSSDSVFLSSVQSLMENVTTLAPQNGGYAAQSAGGVYALAQCLGYLNESECLQCLTSVNYRSLCDSALGEQWYSVSCYYRYEIYSFFTATPPPSSTPPAPPQITQAPGTKTAIIITSAVLGVVFAIVALYLTLALRRRKAKTRKNLPAHEDEAWSRPLFQPKAKVFTLHELEVATRNFHPDNKLGEGGFGVVYKGTLPNGHDVAVKKLSSGSQQGRREFMNEVNLITSVQHRNLIKLLGSCVEGLERMLVYEYLPNKSVDALLFGDSTNGRKIANWPIRYGIILGMARGLSYLHEESQVRIIHRDIKPSNILLDDQLNPVIADFGLARLVSDEESHINTRVAGTLGYLAPEYAIHGELTEKADVFSFGIVTLEVISGRRNSKTKLLEWTWKLYQQQRQVELVYPKLATFSIEQVIRVVHVALLCTQEIPELRPTMSIATLFLSGSSDNIVEMPTKPAFVGLSDSRLPLDSLDHLQSFTSQNYSRNSTDHVSNNAQSVSDVEPR